MGYVSDRMDATGFVPRMAWCVVPMAAGAGMIAYAPALRANIILFFIGWMAIAAGMILAYRRWSAWVRDEVRAVRFVLAVAVCLRIAMIPMVPSLSDDLWRYAWDGHVFAAGHNPYAYAPVDPRLAPLRDEAYPNVAYPTSNTIYPPLTELAFGGCAAVSNALFGGSPRATMVLWKLIVVAVEIVTLLLLANLLRARRAPMRRLLLYAWHPLPIVEFAGQGHSDALLVAGIAGMLLALAGARPVRATLSYAASIAARGVSVIYAPVLLRTLGWRRVAAALVIGAIVLLPFVSADAIAGVSAAVRSMSAVFVFNAFGFWIVYTICEAAHWWTVEPWITAGLAVVFFAVVIVVAVRVRNASLDAAARAMLAVTTGAALLLWNLHPWYFAWGLILVPLVPSRAWMWLTIVSGLTYIHYIEGSTPWFIAVGVLEYGGFLAFLAFEWRRKGQYSGNTVTR